MKPHADRFPIQKNGEFPLTVTAMSSEGNGVGRYQGIAVFVPRTCVGDEILCHVVKVASSYAVGRVAEIITPSADRIESDCPVDTLCGGCTYRQATYEAELRYKQARVSDAFERIGSVRLPVPAVIPSPKTEGYRNKAILPVARAASGEIVVGYYAPRSHRVCDARHCRLSPPAFHTAADLFAAFLTEFSLSVYDEQTRRGLVRALYLRRAEVTGELFVCPVVNGETLPHAQELVSRLRASLPEIVGVALCRNENPTNVVLTSDIRPLWGRCDLQENFCDLQFTVSPRAFWQVNSPQAEALYRTAAEFAGLTGNEVLLDLYCGTGSIGLSMAHRVRELCGVEIVPEAVENARRNAAQNGIANARFLCADAATAARTLEKEELRPDVVLLDPPRAGCDAALVKTVAREFAPERVVYVSCDPATLARDCALFADSGYRVTRVQPFDLFPRTPHVETVALLVRTVSSI